MATSITKLQDESPCVRPFFRLMDTRKSHPDAWLFLLPVLNFSADVNLDAHADMIGKVRRMGVRDKRLNTETAKLTGLTRNTVKKWLKAPGEEIPRYCRTVLDGKLTAYEEALGRGPVSTEAWPSKRTGAV